MAKGLRPHRCVWVHEKSIKKYDYEREALEITDIFYCPICSKTHKSKRYEYRPPPDKERVQKVLERNKKKFGNR